MTTVAALLLISQGFKSLPEIPTSHEPCTPSIKRIGDVTVDEITTLLNARYRELYEQHCDFNDHEGSSKLLWALFQAHQHLQRWQAVLDHLEAG